MLFLTDSFVPDIIPTRNRSAELENIDEMKIFMTVSFVIQQKKKNNNNHKYKFLTEKKKT